MIIGKKNRPLIDLGIITTVIILLMTALSETASAGLTATSLDFAENYLAVKWVYKSGDSWENSPLPPTVGGGYVYSAADGELLKFGKEDGKIEKKVSLPGMQGFSLIPIRYIKKDEYTEGKNLLLIPVYNEKLPETVRDIPRVQPVLSAVRRYKFMMRTHCI